MTARGVTRKLILNGRAIRPRGLLFLIQLLVHDRSTVNRLIYLKGLPNFSIMINIIQQ